METAVLEITQEGEAKPDPAAAEQDLKSLQKEHNDLKARLEATEARLKEKREELEEKEEEHEDTYTRFNNEILQLQEAVKDSEAKDEEIY